ncbi:MAG: YidB family protein [Gammaproteobacteria bacterium]|nr:YidB family protein [Gammaproteobacteria bacterium]
MDLMQIATQMIGQKLSSSNGANNELVSSVIGSLLGGGSGQSGIDLGSLVGNLQKSGLGDIATSWLGDGDNDHISRSQIADLLGSDKIQQAANQLGADQNDLLRGLQELLPQMVDKSSKGGSLLDDLGGVGGLASLASKFLK